jgi:hypothetical protein
MSPRARAHRDRFDDVCRVELVRLRRRTASRSPEQRAHLQVASLEATRALEAGLDGQPDGLHDIVGPRIFGISASAPSTAPEAVMPAD